MKSHLQASLWKKVELSTFGFTHCGIGDYVAKTWRLPVEIPDLRNFDASS